jgi:hypothetical protein
MAIHQEAAYERLYRWMQSKRATQFIYDIFFWTNTLHFTDECRLLCNDMVEINEFMSTAMLTLTFRPMLYR